MCTLRFADRARNVTNNTVVHVEQDLATVVRLKDREIARLRRLVAGLLQGRSGPIPPDTEGEVVVTPRVNAGSETVGSSAECAGGVAKGGDECTVLDEWVDGSVAGSLPIGTGDGDTAPDFSGGGIYLFPKRQWVPQQQALRQANKSSR